MDNEKTPLFHISKRDDLPWQKAGLFRIAAILLALIVCALVTMLITGENPIGIYATILDGALGSSRRIWMLLQNTAILLLASLALTPAFRMRFWNIGGEGQMLMGGVGAAACMIVLGESVPGPVLILLMVLSSLALGGLWGFIPALFKAKWNTNETLFTLMMNYVAL